MLAFLQEHGPYVVPDGSNKFIKNPYSWNREANMLYIEQPAGVGFSYCDSDNTNECDFNDNNVAQDNLATVLSWFEKYPEYKKHDLWISGESYAGVYVPYLVNAIHHHN
jgi:serine carboxypeptidase-like clade 2